MGCLSLEFVEQLLIWLVVIGAVVAILNLVLMPLLAPAPYGATVVAVIRILIWAIVAIAVIYLVFGLLECLVGFPRLR